MLSTTTIDQVRELPIEQVIGQYVTLKQTGHSLKACCPLHNEKTPSFVVFPVKNSFHCFGCGAGGDGIQFVMLHDNLPFTEAVISIAKQHNVTIEETETKGKTPEQISDEAIMHKVLELAQRTYRAKLQAVSRDDKEAMDRLRYLRWERNLSRASIIDWGLGICPEFQVITPEIISGGYFSQAEKCGVIRTKEGKSYDYFHHRYTIPIHDLRGELIGFGGRVVKGVDYAKYFNPPESPLYNKSKTLFGLHKARKNFKKHGMAVLVEGYFDVIKLHQNDWDNAVATCGTAFTEGQAKTLRRFTDTVLVMRDGDKAGIAAMEKDIPILVAEQFTVYVCVLPSNEDPDTLFDKRSNVVNVVWNYTDGIEYLATKYHEQGALSASDMAKAIEQAVKLLALITNSVRREQYIKSFAKIFKCKAHEFVKPLNKLFKYQEEQKKVEQEESDYLNSMPDWVDRNAIYDRGFVQLTNHTKGYRAGIYFLDESRKLMRVTNFTIKPLYHIYEVENNRRLVEVTNTIRTALVDVPSNAFTNQTIFENELMNKGHFVTEHTFGKKQFKNLANWLSSEMPLSYELKTLGWQPEGFFAFSNVVWHKDNLIDYDDNGMVRIEDKHYLSIGNSRIQKDERLTDNPYENDLYLTYVKPKSDVNYSRWAKLFCLTYADNAPYGIAYTFLTIFKDLVTQVAKLPLLYCYGPKGSGKSQMAESLTWLFFSGKNSDKELIKGFNLNKGQYTPFSFFNRVSRFRNCPILMNEFDENNIEDFAFGAFKSSYDGEGREVGNGNSKKTKGTTIQKILGTVILVGQYLSTRDDGSVLSRSISCNFSLERLGNLTEEQMQAHDDLKKIEKEGLSSLIIELIKYRDQVKEKLHRTFLQVQSQLTEETRKSGHRIEARLLSNYSLTITAIKLMTELGIDLPFKYEEFYSMAKNKVIDHNKMLKDNSAIQQFWKGVEFMFDKAIITDGLHFKKQKEDQISIKNGDKTTEVIKFNYPTEVLYFRFENVHKEYMDNYRKRTGKQAIDEQTLLNYMKEQPYFIGLVTAFSFNDRRTSCYAFNYTLMQNEFGIGLEKDNHHKAEKKQEQPPAPSNDPPPPHTSDDLPF